jgi:hypothetical protein
MITIAVAECRSCAVVRLGDGSELLTPTRATTCHAPRCQVHESEEVPRGASHTVERDAKWRRRAKWVHTARCSHAPRLQTVLLTWLGLGWREARHEGAVTFVAVAPYHNRRVVAIPLYHRTHVHHLRRGGREREAHGERLHDNHDGDDARVCCKHEFHTRLVRKLTKRKL